MGIGIFSFVLTLILTRKSIWKGIRTPHTKVKGKMEIYRKVRLFGIQENHQRLVEAQSKNNGRTLEGMASNIGIRSKELCSNNAKTLEEYCQNVRSQSDNYWRNSERVMEE